MNPEDTMPCFAWFNMARTHTRIYPAPVSTQQSGKNLKMFF